jgi:hypothetical protein
VQATVEAKHGSSCSPNNSNIEINKKAGLSPFFSFFFSWNKWTTGKTCSLSKLDSANFDFIYNENKRRGESTFPTLSRVLLIKWRNIGAVQTLAWYILKMVIR